jgi:hypothetical protein
MMSKMDEIFKRVLNDKDIFWSTRQIFSEEEWVELRGKYNTDEFIGKIKAKIEDMLKEKNTLSNDNKKKELDECVKLCEGLLRTSKETPNIALQILTFLQSFGLVKCNLPNNMDDYGKVIERYGRATVEQFFLDKVQRESYKYRKRALKKVLEYVKELYNSNLSSEEIAYFVRKLDSLKTFWEVLNV